MDAPSGISRQDRVLIATVDRLLLALSSHVVNHDRRIALQVHGPFPTFTVRRITLPAGKESGKESVEKHGKSA